MAVHFAWITIPLGPMKSLFKLVALLFVFVVGFALFILSPRIFPRAPQAEEQRQQHFLPPDVSNPRWLSSRKEAQLATVDRFDIFYDFSFSDRVEESGIRFSHKMVDDAGKLFKPVHYDHGNGLSIADVDNDGLYDVYFTTQVGDNELWRNLGDGTFEDITQAAGVALHKPVSVAASFADVDNDGDPDLYVTTVRFGNFLFENDGTGQFTDISMESGLHYVGHSSGAVFFDYNRDGLLDLFLTNVGTYTTDELAPIKGRTRFDKQEGEYSYYVGINDAFSGHLMPERYEQSILYKNVGNNRFTDVSKEMGLLDTRWSGDASPIDVNEDGWTDLYVLSMQGNDEYYENVKGERFVRKTRSVFPKTPWGAMGVKVFDYNNDGRMDLYITDMHCDMWETNEFFNWNREKQRPHLVNVPSESSLGTRENIYGNALFRNEGHGHFTEVTKEMDAETYWPWGLSVGDLNADGYEDVFVSASMNFPFRYAVNSVLLNNRGKRFLDSEFIVGVEPRREGRTAKVWFEIDCEENDVDRGVCQTSQASEQYDVWGAVGTRSSVIFDLDNDGDLDIITNDFNSEPLVLVSNLTERKDDVHYLKIKLVGTTSNRDGLGATVTVRTGEHRYVKVQDGVSGYLSHSIYPLYFGLGEASTVDQVEVRWPSGKTQVVQGPIAINAQLEVKEE